MLGRQASTGSSAHAGGCVMGPCRRRPGSSGASAESPSAGRRSSRQGGQSSGGGCRARRSAALGSPSARAVGLSAQLRQVTLQPPEVAVLACVSDIKRLSPVFL